MPALALTSSEGVGHQLPETDRVDADLGLAPSWQAWVVDNLVRGASATRLVESLADSGVPWEIAEREVAAIADSPVMVSYRALHRRTRRLELLAQLQQALARLAPQPGSVERRELCDTETFFNRYYAENRPVVFTDATAGWKAREWTPGLFAERFGDLKIEITDGRESDPHYDRNFKQHLRTLPLAEYVEMVEAHDTDHGTNDFYMVSNNRAMRREGLHPLLEDLDPPADMFDMEQVLDGCSLWLGPAGSITPLHHDPTNVFFSQFYGRKRIRLMAPYELWPLQHSQGYYVPFDLNDPEFGERHGEHVVTHDVVLEPGETLFIPAGWFHQVEALDVSISFSLLNFRLRNDFSWYRPGFQ